MSMFQYSLVTRDGLYKLPGVLFCHYSEDFYYFPFVVESLSLRSTDRRDFVLSSYLIERISSGLEIILAPKFELLHCFLASRINIE